MSQSKEGYLTKLGKVVKSWKKRWFVLNGSQLSYYDKPGKKQLGSIDMSKVIQVELNDDPKRENSFKIIIPNTRTYVIIADSKQECLDWVNALNRIIKKEPISAKNSTSPPSINSQ